MAKFIVGRASSAQLGDIDTTAKMPIGVKVLDNEGNEYIYVGASGVAVGLPVKMGVSTSALSKCVAGTGVVIMGVATASFPTTSFTYGFVGTRGVHPTKVPSGTAQGTIVAGGSGTTAAAVNTDIPTKVGETLATAANAGTNIDVFWF